MIDFFEKRIKEYDDKTVFVDVRFGESENQAISTENNELKTCNHSVGKAYSVRMLVNNAWGFSASNDFKKVGKVFKEAYRLARSSSRLRKNKIGVKGLKTYKDKVVPKNKNPLIIPLESKIELLLDLYKTYDYKHLRTVMNGMFMGNNKITYLNSNGSNITEQSTFTRISSFINGLRNGNLQNTYFIKCASMGWELFEKISVEQEAANTQEQLKRLLSARAPKPGKYNIIADSMMSGTFFHEALGHSLEADHLYSGTSCIKKKGQVIGPGFLTMSDDPTLKDYWGSYKYDDEGTKARKSVLVKNGVVVNFMNNIPTFFDMPGMKKTSSGRAMNIMNYPIPRMSNTVVSPGKHSRKELFEELKNGLYVTGFEGGAVDTNTGVFSFKTREAFIVKNGRIVKNLKDVNLSGNVLETVKNIKAIGKDSRNNYSGGMCGKSSQSVPVSDIVPEILIGGVLVGN